MANQTKPNQALIEAKADVQRDMADDQKVAVQKAGQRDDDRKVLHSDVALGISTVDQATAEAAAMAAAAAVVVPAAVAVGFEGSHHHDRLAHPINGPTLEVVDLARLSLRVPTSLPAARVSRKKHFVENHVEARNKRHQPSLN